MMSKAFWIFSKYVKVCKARGCLEKPLIGQTLVKWNWLYSVLNNIGKTVLVYF